MVSSLRMTVYGPDLQPRFVLGDFRTMTASMRWHSKATGTVTLPWSHPRVPAMLEPGTAAAIDYFVGDSLDEYGDATKWRRLVNGPLWDITGEGPVASGVVTFTVHDALWLQMEGTLAWPNPDKAVTAQTSEYRELSGPLETVFKTIFAENVVARLGAPFIVEPDGGLGSTVDVSLRFDNLADSFQDLLLADGVGVRAVLEPGAYRVQAWTPDDRTSRVITEATGMLVDWQLARSGPVATRDVAGGSGTGAARVMGSFADTTAEALWGLPMEHYSEDQQLTTTADLNAFAQAEQAKIGATAGVSASLAEVGWLRYGKSLWIGDLMTVAPTPELSMTERCTTCTITFNPDDGLEVVPVIGNDSIEQSPDAILVGAITRMAKYIRKQRSSR